MVAGKVDEVGTATSSNDAGEVRFTAVRLQTVVYKITAGQPHPRGQFYVISSTVQATAYVKVWDATGTLPINTDFHIVAYTSPTAGADSVFYFQLYHKLI